MGIVDYTQNFFSADSPLRESARDDGSDFAFEYRPQQRDMAIAVSKALESRRNLCVEAPTGVGKTFAYLIPALHYSLAQETPVLISTHTIHLQEQLFHHDIPFLERVLNHEIKAVVAKGRSHYLCLRKFNALANTDQMELPGGNDELGELNKLIAWGDSTQTGDDSEINFRMSPGLWDRVASERGNCLNAQCPFFKSCFLQRARRQLAQANIIIANHAFFFSALAMDDPVTASASDAETPSEPFFEPETEISPEDDYTYVPLMDGEELVVESGNDDCTNSHRIGGGDSLLPECCAVIIDEAHTLEDTAAKHLAVQADSFTLNKLLGRLFSEDKKRGLLANKPQFADALVCVEDVRHKAKTFFADILKWLNAQQKDILRYTSPNHIPDSLHDDLTTLANRLTIITNTLTKDENDFRVELDAVRTGLLEQRDAMTVFFSMSATDSVYWMEIDGRNQTDLSFHVVPIDVAPLLRTRLFCCPPIILTSATLAVDQKLKFFIERIGAVGADELILTTPFDFMSQAKVYLSTNLPEPNSPAFLRASIPVIEQFLKQTNGRAFVLFTSHKALNDTADLLEDFCKRNHYRLMRQRDGLSPQRMVEEFKRDGNAVIFGTASFWTGVDVPGSALSNVIITRLPFSVPDDPLVEARTQRIEATGGRSFFDYSVPEAILKFRQGIGRLIRTSSDHGIIVILDSRIKTKNYGRMFLRAIPPCPVEDC